MKSTIVSLVLMASFISAMEEVDYSFTAEDYETFQDAMKVREMVVGALKEGGVWFQEQWGFLDSEQMSQGVAVDKSPSIELPCGVLTPWGKWRFIKMYKVSKEARDIGVQLSQKLDLQPDKESGFYTVNVSRYKPKRRNKEDNISRDQALRIWWEMMFKFERERNEDSEYKAWNEGVRFMPMTRSEWGIIEAIGEKYQQEKYNSEKSCLIL